MIFMRGPQTSLRENLASREALRFQLERFCLRSASMRGSPRAILLEALKYLEQPHGELCELSDGVLQIRRQFYLQ
jgi:hypothetical protein